MDVQLRFQQCFIFQLCRGSLWMTREKIADLLRVNLCAEINTSVQMSYFTKTYMTFD
jgi:hypothetical protein